MKVTSFVMVGRDALLVYDLLTDFSFEKERERDVVRDHDASFEDVAALSDSVMDRVSLASLLDDRDALPVTDLLRMALTEASVRDKEGE